MDELHLSQLHISEDRLSELPDSLILEILSLLEMRDVVRTNILSKRWKDLWATIPCLDFFDTQDSCVFKHMDTFQNFICGALAQWRGAKILRFSLALCGPFFSDKTSDIDSWLHLAIEKQVEELLISLENWKALTYIEYCLPRRLFSCSSITKLSITYCSLRIEESVQWNQLKSLRIEGCESLSEDSVSKILAGAPHLEELILIFDRTGGDVIIRSSSLKMLQIGRRDSWSLGFATESNAELRIWAPNLVTLETTGLICREVLLDVPSLTDAILHFDECFEPLNSCYYLPMGMFNRVFRCICHVKKVTLSSDLCIKFLVYLKSEELVKPLSDVEFLKLYSLEAEEFLDILELFPNLKILIVNQSDKVYEIDSVASGIVLLKPSLLLLKRVEITWSVCDASIIQVMEYLLENAHELEKMVLRLRMAGADTEAFVLAEEKVRSMPRSSATAQLIIISQV